MIGIGIIGGGMMSQVGHLPFYLDDPRCTVLGVAESRPSLIEALRQTYGVERVVDHHRELLADPAIDAVVISAPRPATATITLEAIGSGKHVLAEKPMALTTEDAQALVGAARDQGVIYAVGFMKRYDPGVARTRKIVSDCRSDGRLGALLLARFYNFTKSYAMAPPPHTRPMESRIERFAESTLWPDWLPAALRGAYGWIINAASHDLNLVNYFFEAGVSVDAAVCRGEEVLVAILRAGETPVHLEVAKSETGTWREGAEFLFERGRIAVEIPSPMARAAVGTVAVEGSDTAGLFTDREMASGWSFELQARGFLDALEGKALPRTAGEDGLRDMRLNEAIWRMIAGAGE